MRTASLFAIVGVLASTALMPASAETLLLRNARVYTVSHGVLDKADVLIQDGRIAAVSPNVSVPTGTRILDLAGKVIMPGIVDANARFGMAAANEQSAEVTLGVRAAQLADPRSPEFRRALQGGVTTACLNPGPANVIGGVSATVRTAGPNLKAMTMRDAVALRAALGADTYAGNSGFRGGGGDALASIYLRRPNSRMAAVWELRKVLSEADRSPVLRQVIAGTLPLRVHARTENDIRAFFNVMDEFQLRRVILDDAVEAYKVADQLAARKVPVVLGPFGDPQTVSPEGANAALNAAGLLAAKGVPIAFGSNGGDPADLRIWACLAARNGLAEDAALRAITLGAAEIAGVAKRVGSIEPGKEANLLVLSGDPLQLTSRIETVILRGQVVHHAL
jgi:imidazolonepropionase-like amidohydrolase